MFFVAVSDILTLLRLLILFMRFNLLYRASAALSVCTYVDKVSYTTFNYLTCKY